MRKQTSSPQTTRTHEKFSKPKIEKMIRSRSRTSADQIIEAAAYAGNRGWFMLTLRLLDVPSKKKGVKNLPFRHRWLLAQARAAMSDFSGALEALQLEGDITSAEARKKTVFEMILQLSI